jgi:phosphoribosylglycinamide formyltransferase 1
MMNQFESLATVTAQHHKLKLAVLISGSGRTLKNFIDLAAEGELPVDIRLVVSSSAKAGGLKFAEEAGIPTLVVSRGDFAAGEPGDKPFGDAIFDECREAAVDYVAMAGFLRLAPVPPDFAGRVVNIHPALIPAFCGPGMYGHRVHEAALAAGVRVTGCTVHFVDNQYDHGPIIWQQPVPVFEDDTADTLAKRVFEAEKEAYPHVLKLLAADRVHLEHSRVKIRKAQRGKNHTGSNPID